MMRDPTRILFKDLFHWITSDSTFTSSSNRFSVLMFHESVDMVSFNVSYVKEDFLLVPCAYVLNSVRALRRFKVESPGLGQYMSNKTGSWFIVNCLFWSFKSHRLACSKPPLPINLHCGPCNQFKCNFRKIACYDKGYFCYCCVSFYIAYYVFYNRALQGLFC